MRHILSLFFWVGGIAFFLMSFPALVFCLLFLSRPVTFKIAKSLFAIQIRIMGIRLVVTGQDNIKPNTSYLIMGNHTSLFDLFVVPVAIPLVFVGIEAAYHFSLPVWGYLIKKWGNIPIERRNLKKAILSLNTAKQTLASGIDIAVLPEGHRTLTGELGPFKKGPFHLAKQTNADILPFGIHGLFEYNKKGSVLIRPGTVVVNIGRPVSNAAIKSMTVDVLAETVRGKVKQLIKP